MGADGNNSDKYTFHISMQESQTMKPIFQVRMVDTPIHKMADSGATVNIMSKKDFDSLKPKLQLTNTNVKVYPYMSAELLNLCGKLRAYIASNHCSSEETFYVAEGSSGSTLSWTTSQKLNLIKAVSMVEHSPVNLPPGAPDFLKDFPGLTSGIGEYKGEPVRIHVDNLSNQPHSLTVASRFISEEK